MLLSILVHNTCGVNKLSDPNPVPKKIREQYEEIKLGRGTPRVDSNGAQKIFPATELKQRSGFARNVWEGSFEWDVPGTTHRILQRPDGLFGYVANHSYEAPKIFPAP